MKTNSSDTKSPTEPSIEVNVEHLEIANEKITCGEVLRILAVIFLSALITAFLFFVILKSIQNFTFNIAVVLLCAVLSTMLLVAVWWCKSPTSGILAIVGCFLTAVCYIEALQEGLNKALAVHAPVQCKGVVYTDYYVKEGYIVAENMAFNKRECIITKDNQ